MKTESLYITSSVVARANVAAHNGKIILEKPASDVAAFAKELYKSLKLDYSKFYKMDNLSKLAFVSAELLLEKRSLAADYKPDEVALVFSNASSSLDTDKTYFNSVEDKSNYFPSPAVFVYTLPNIMIGEICIRHHLLGENTFFISEKFDAELLSEYTENIISSGKAACAMVGWVEIHDSDWEAALFLVEKKEKENSGILSPDTLQRLYESVLK